MAKYSIEFKKSAVKELNKIPKKDLKIIVRKIASLENNPRPHDSKKLSGLEKYRIRHGQYRILYEIFDQLLIINVVKIGNRKDIYR